MCKYVIKKYESKEGVYIVEDIDRKRKSFEELEESISNPPLFSRKKNMNKIPNSVHYEDVSVIEYLAEELTKK